MGRLGSLVLLLLASSAVADGFHSPLLTQRDPKSWAITVRESLGLDRSGSIAEDGAGGRGGAHERRAKAPQLLQAFRYLDRKNIRLKEFPAFNFGAIPEFRAEIEQLLIEIGEDAVPLLANTLVKDIVSGTPTENGLSVAAKFLERVEAILIAIGDPSVVYMVRYLDHENADVRRAVLRVIRGVAKGRVSFGADKDRWAAWARILEVESKKPADAVARLVPLLRDGDETIEREAVRVLGSLRRSSATTALLDYAARNRDAEKRFVATVRAIGMCGARSTAPFFLDLLDDARVAVRTEAATALRFLAGRSFGYDAKADADKRAPAVARWRAWAAGR